MRLHAVILAGGKGERFWPLSRARRPKQFLPLFGERTLLQETVGRLSGWIPWDRVWTVAGVSMLPEIRRQARELRADRTIEEAVPRNTAAAIAAAAVAIERLDPGAAMLVLPSDHWIPDRDLFREDTERMLDACRDDPALYLFGMPVTRPETGFGYLRLGPEVPAHPGVFEVERFHEKPDSERAVAFARDPSMLWNSGIFLWPAVTILRSIARHAPILASCADRLRDDFASAGGVTGQAAAQALARFFQDCPSESIDYAVLEKEARAFATRARFRWSDLGSWDSWGEQVEADSAGNRARGAVLARESRNCIAYSEDGLLALLGVEGLIAVRLPDVTLVCPRERAQEIRALLRDARERGDLDGYL
ncbi:MAG: mannose-1-phosphate guanylyltransferase [Candidatus Eisenbacteria bacterium]|nr:sugar phosphate nucleotidyltransferase [Candidatus Eisenbacteria bacterium]